MMIEETTKVNSWILASRPKTLLAAIVPVLVGSAVAVHEQSFYPLLSVTALICSLLIQIGTNFTNDLYDYLKGADTERRKGPVRVLASGLITVKEMRAGIFIVFMTAFIFGMYLVYEAGFFVLVIGVLSILAGLAYTAGPYPLAYNGLGDLFVFIFFGIVGTSGTAYLHLKEISPASILCAVPVGALITNILVVNNFRDIEEDREAGKSTLAVKIGKSLTRYQFIFLLIVSFIIPFILFYFYDFSIFIMLPYLALPLAWYLITMLYKLEGTHLNKTLELTAKFSAIYGILFSIGLII